MRVWPGNLMIVCRRLCHFYLFFMSSCHLCCRSLHTDRSPFYIILLFIFALLLFATSYIPRSPRCVVTHVLCIDYVKACLRLKKNYRPFWSIVMVSNMVGRCVCLMCVCVYKKKTKKEGRMNDFLKNKI